MNRSLYVVVIVTVSKYIYIYIIWSRSPWPRDTVGGRGPGPGGGGNASGSLSSLRPEDAMKLEEALGSTTEHPQSTSRSSRAYKELVDSGYRVIYIFWRVH